MIRVFPLLLYKALLFIYNSHFYLVIVQEVLRQRFGSHLTYTRQSSWETNW